MPKRFSDTLRSLEGSKSAGSGGLATMAVGAVLLGLWASWLTLAEVHLYEVSQNARVEVDSTPRPVDAPNSGRIEHNLMALGGEVETGDVLVQLERSSEDLEVATRESRIAEIDAAFEATKLELAAEQSALEARRSEAELEQHEIDVQISGLLTQLASLERALQRDRDLFEQGITSEEQLEAAVSAHSTKTSEIEERRAAAARVRQRAAREIEDRRTRIAHLEGSLAASRTLRATAVSELVASQNAADERTIVAPASGTLGEIAALPKGSYVEAGATIGTILPHGVPRVVAQFDPSAIGRIMPGQSAKLHLTGFPSAQYGTVEATVERVARELSEGRLRVELRVRSEVHGPIPLGHGLPGRVEIRVESARPLSLLLRAAGGLVPQQRSEV